MSADKDKDTLDRAQLEAFCDNELDSAERARVAERIAAGDERVGAALRECHLIGAEVRQWALTQVEQVRASSTWEAIASEINALAAERRTGVRSLRLNSLRNLLQEVGDRFVDFTDGFRLAPAFAAGVAVALITFSVVGSGNETKSRSFDEFARLSPNDALPSATVLPLSSASQSFSSASQSLSSANQSLDAAALVPVGLGPQALSLPDQTREAYASRLRQNQQRFIDSLSPEQRRAILQKVFRVEPALESVREMPIRASNVLRDNFVQGGLRAGGADIDFIHSPHPFRIVSPAEQNVPPVIWVSQR